VILLGLVLASTAANLIIEGVEKSNSVAYGQKIRISEGDINVVRSGDKGPTLVLLTGLGTAAPGLDFAPLIRELNGFQTVVVEPFGYGYSDTSARPRTLENVSEELHEVLSKLNVDKPYTLVGHSIAGFYTLYYANKYPGEVSAVVGIDPTVAAGKTPETGSDPAEMPRADNFWIKLAVNTGLVRWLGLGGEPGGNDYTQAERQQIREMGNWNYGNQAVTDETLRIGENARKLQNMSYPDALPVLDFLAQETMNERADWIEVHERLANPEHHEIVVLDGQHYLQWTQSKVMADKIKEFLGKIDGN
jgi:pimeloyl-ACP methyl ester carboxylesterase